MFFFVVFLAFANKAYVELKSNSPVVRGAKVIFEATLHNTENESYQYIWRDNGIPTQSRVSIVVVVVTCYSSDKFLMIILFKTQL